MAKKELHNQPLKYMEYRKNNQKQDSWDKLIKTLSVDNLNTLVGSFYLCAFVGFVCGVITTIIFNWLCR